MLKVSVVAAIVGALLAPLGANACAVYLLVGPIIALIWLIVSSIRSNPGAGMSSILVFAGTGLLAFFVAAFIGGLITGAIMESIKPGSSFMHEQTATQTGTPQTGTSQPAHNP